MLPALALVLGAAAPALVGHAASTFAGDQLTLVVRTNGPVPPGAKGELVGNLLRVRVPGAALGQPAYAFQDPAGGIVRAQQPRPGEVVFDVPLPEGRSCPGPVVFDPPRKPGVVAHVACPEAAPAAGPVKQDPPPVKSMEAAPEPAADATKADATETDSTKADATKADATETDATKADAKAAPEPARDDPTSPWAALGPVFLLAAVALAAWVYAQRKAAPNRQLHVVESVSLGPRRQLIVARFRDELLVVGSSESGITLLASRAAGQGAFVPAPAPVPAAAQTAPSPAPSAPVVAATQPASGDPGLDAGSLRALAERMARQGDAARPAEAPAGKSFDSLLDESYEDENLRRKLAKGLGGRVS